MALGEIRACSPEALNDRGVRLALDGRYDEAIACYQAAVTLAPRYARALNNLGLALLERGRVAEAATMYRRAIGAAPDNADAYDGLAAALARLGNFEEAVAQYRSALARAPDHVPALANLGDLLRRTGALDEAETLQSRAVRLRPEDPRLLNLLGLTLHERHDFGEALRCFRHAVALAPADPAGHMNLAMALFASGDMPGGAAEYEWRWRGFNGTRPPSFDAPLWDGRKLTGTLLLWAEQGFGDTIQFARFAPLLRQRAARVLLAAPKPLAGLLRTAPGLDGVFGLDEPLPPIDAHLPLMSAMHRLGTTLATIPSPLRYLAAEPQRRARFSPLIGGGACRVGLIWGGNPRHENDRRRSLPPALLSTLLAEPGFRFFGLQRGTYPSPFGARLDDLAPHLDDFADTAAAMTELDLIVSVDTAAAHLAGALGRPCFLLLSRCADWRWLVGRSDTPWYPSLRLFRQSRLDEWEPVVAALRAALHDFRAGSDYRGPRFGGSSSGGTFSG